MFVGVLLPVVSAATRLPGWRQLGYPCGALVPVLPQVNAQHGTVQVFQGELEEGWGPVLAARLWHCVRPYVLWRVGGCCRTVDAKL